MDYLRECFVDSGKNILKVHLGGEDSDAHIEQRLLILFRNRFTDKKS